MNLIVQLKGRTVFSSDGKWLHPLFDLEEFLKEGTLDPRELSLEDKLIGRGAAVLIVRMGIRRCHGRIVSRRALPVLETHGVECTWDELTDRLACQTETALTDEMSLDDSYEELARRAGRTGC